jgi:hypothetical protein
LWFFSAGCGHGRDHGRRYSFSLTANHSQRRSHRRPGSWLDQDLFDYAILKDLDINRALICLYGGDNIASFDVIARFHPPVVNGTGLHVCAQAGHSKFGH